MKIQNSISSHLISIPLNLLASQTLIAEEMDKEEDRSTTKATVELERMEIRGKIIHPNMLTKRPKTVTVSATMIMSSMSIITTTTRARPEHLRCR